MTSMLQSESCYTGRRVSGIAENCRHHLVGVQLSLSAVFELFRVPPARTLFPDGLILF